MPDTGIKRFVLDAETRGLLAEIGQKYGLSMQDLAGVALRTFLQEVEDGNAGAVFVVEQTKKAHDKIIAARMKRAIATRRAK